MISLSALSYKQQKNFQTASDQGSGFLVLAGEIDTTAKITEYRAPPLFVPHDLQLLLFGKWP